MLVQVTKDPIGHKGARLTRQISLPGRYLVYVPEGCMTGISPQAARHRARPPEEDPQGGRARDAPASSCAPPPRAPREEELRADVERLTATWEDIKAKADSKSGKAKTAARPLLVHGEPDLTVRVIRDVFNEDFT